MAEDNFENNKANVGKNGSDSIKKALEDLNLKKDLFSIINERRSWRTFVKKDLSKNDREKLIEYMEQSGLGPFGTRFGFRLIDVPEKDRSERKKMGTYGMISGAPSYLVGFIEKNHSASGIYEFGYTMERIILKATDLGLGSCWLGGTFNKEGFTQIIKRSPPDFDFKILAISPIGYIDEKRSIKGKIIRKVLKASIRKPLNELFHFVLPNGSESAEKGDIMPIFDNSDELRGEFREDFGDEKAGIIASALKCVQRAPSAKNKQSWRIIISKSPKGGIVADFYFNADSSDSQIFNFQRIDIGIAMCHFELYLGSKDVFGKWDNDNFEERSIISYKAPANYQFIVRWQSS